MLVGGGLPGDWLIGDELPPVNALLHMTGVECYLEDGSNCAACLISLAVLACSVGSKIPNRFMSAVSKALAFSSLLTFFSAVPWAQANDLSRSREHCMGCTKDMH